MSNSVVKVFKVEVAKKALGLKTWFHVEALSMGDAIQRVAKFDCTLEVVGIEDHSTLYHLIPMDPREKAEIETEAARLGLDVAS